jgi:putative ABC transport system permease protein
VLSNPLNPKILGLRLSLLVHLYGRRLRAQFLQEALAGCGIAVGVALVFGVLLANTSLTSSASELVHGIVGNARLALVARSDSGFSEQTATRVAALRGVQVAASVLQQDAAIVGPDGRSSVQLFGVTPGIVSLGGSATQDLQGGPLLVLGGLGLPSEVASLIGARPGQTVTVLVAGQAHRIAVRAVLGSRIIGPVAQSPIAVALLSTTQRLTGREGRVSEVFVQPRSGMEATVRRELRRIANGRLSVVPADNELRQLQATAATSNQATTLFAAIGGMVGFLLAFNAMLLTVPERRRNVADLRMQGFDWRQALLVVAFEATALGLVASVLGVGLGALFSHAFLHRVPVYLAFAFPIGSQQVVHLGTLLPAVACGLLAALSASFPVAADVRPGRTRDAVLRETGHDGELISDSLARRLGLTGLGLVAGLTALSLLQPGLTLLAGVLLAVATVCLIPAMFTGFGRIALYVNERLSSAALVIASRELRYVGVRTVALSGVGALAIFGSVAIGGARHDLIAGSDVNFSEYLDTANLWVTVGGNDLTTNSFRAGDLPRKLAHLHGIAAVRRYQGELMDVGRRRLWIVGRSSQDPTILPGSQILQGSLTRGDALVRAGGWAGVSNGFAREHSLHVGSRFQLPTPSGEAPLRVAAVMTNTGWPPGAIVLNSTDYRRLWHTDEPSALEITLDPTVSEAAGKRLVEGALAGTPGLAVQTRGERKAQYASNSRQALESLRQISILLLIAAALAVASALSAAIWQRRPELASLNLQGYDRRQLWRALFAESCCLLVTGSAVGALLGLYGHLLASRWLKLSGGFPAPFSLGAGQMLGYFGLVCAIALVVVAIPGLAAARVSPRVALHEQ